MAVKQEVIVSTTCDLDGKEAASHVIVFGLDTKNPGTFAVDLCEAHEAKLLKAIDALTVITSAGKRVSAVRASQNGHSNGNGNGKPRARSRGKQVDPAEVRAWAIEQGYEVSGRGRISADLREAFLAAR